MEYISTMQETIDRLSDKLKGIKDSQIDKMCREIAISLEAQNKARVYTKGKDVSGAEIGKYSTKPTLVGAKSFVKKSSVNKVFGKKGKKDDKWVTITRGGKARRLKVMPEGYKQIRQIEGFEAEFVNLSRTKKMMKDLSVGKQGGDWCVGFPTNYSGKLKYAAMIDYFRKKYGKKIFGVSKSDEQRILQIITKYINAKD